MTFMANRLTLADEDTARAYRVTLEIVRRILHGAGAEGIVDAGQRSELDAIVEGMKAVPDLVERSG